MSKPMKPADVPKLIEKLQRDGTYGELSIRLRRGQITSVALTETFLTEGQNQSTGGNQNESREHCFARS